MSAAIRSTLQALGDHCFEKHGRNHCAESKDNWTSSHVQEHEESWHNREWGMVGFALAVTVQSYFAAGCDHNF